MQVLAWVGFYGVMSAQPLFDSTMMPASVMLSM